MVFGVMHIIEKAEFESIMDKRNMYYKLDSNTYIMDSKTGPVVFRYNEENKSTFIGGRIPIELYEILYINEFNGLITPCCGRLIEPVKVVMHQDIMAEVEIDRLTKERDVYRFEAINLLQEHALKVDPDGCYCEEMIVRSPKTLRVVIKLMKNFERNIDEHKHGSIEL